MKGMTKGTINYLGSTVLVLRNL